MGNMRKCFEKSEMSKVHGRIFLQCSVHMGSPCDKMQKEAECCSCGTCRRLSEKDETTMNLTVKFL
jgi:hypothetical protein